MHISSNAITNLSIEAPSVDFLEGKKKGQGLITPSTFATPLNQQNFVIAKEIISHTHATIKCNRIICKIGGICGKIKNIILIF